MRMGCGMIFLPDSRSPMARERGYCKMLCLERARRGSGLARLLMRMDELKDKRLRHYAHEHRHHPVEQARNDDQASLLEPLVAFLCDLLRRVHKEGRKGAGRNPGAGLKFGRDRTGTKRRHPYATWLELLMQRFAQ